MKPALQWFFDVFLGWWTFEVEGSTFHQRPFPAEDCGLSPLSFLRLFTLSLVPVFPGNEPFLFFLVPFPLTPQPYAASFLLLLRFYDFLPSPFATFMGCRWPHEVIDRSPFFSVVALSVLPLGLVLLFNSFFKLPLLL